MNDDFPEIAGCIWCWRQPAPLRDNSQRMCPPCWAIYVVYVADEVEPPDSDFNQLLATVKEIVSPPPERKEP